MIGGGAHARASGLRVRLPFLQAPSKVHKQQLRVDGRVASATYPVDAPKGPCSSLYASANPHTLLNRGVWESQLHARSQPTEGRVCKAPPDDDGGVRVQTDAEADMLLPEGSSAICVQRFDGSRNSAIHTTYRISLRSSSLREPRYPLLRVVFVCDHHEWQPFLQSLVWLCLGTTQWLHWVCGKDTQSRR